ncbi:MAG: hypothetical protein ACRD8U_11765, partial [Pyrinomonadaceae bacterium]
MAYLVFRVGEIAGWSWESLSGAAYFRLFWTQISDEDNRLGAGNFESPATAHVLTCQHVINADHVITRFLKAHAVLLICPSRRTGFFGSLQPAYIILTALTAMGATVGRLFQFLLFVKEILFVHWFILPYLVSDMRELVDH